MVCIKIRHIFQLLVSVSTMLLLSGCIDDMLSYQDEENTIRFAPTVSNLWSNSMSGRTRSPQMPVSAKCESYTVKQLNARSLDGKKPLYLHTRIEDGFVTADPKIVTDNELKTRATQLITGDDAMYDEFRASAYLFTYTWDENGPLPNYFRNEPVKRNSSGSYTLASKFFWPRDPNQYMRFAAYAPHKPGVCYGVDAPYAAMAYCTPSASAPNLDEQTDVLIGSTDEEGMNCETPGVVNLHFRHALAALRFEIGGGMKGAKIISVTMKSVWYNGVINIVSGGMDIAWGAGDMRINVNKKIESDHITDLLDGKVLLLPPVPPVGIPNVERNERLELEMEVNGVVKEETIDISSKLWEAGKTCTYRITNSKYVEVMDVVYGSKQASRDEVDVHLPYNGGTESFNLLSKVDGVTPKALAWKAEFLPDGATEWSATPPSWLRLNMNEGEGSGTDFTRITATSMPINPAVVDLDSVIRSGVVGSPSARYNLSTKAQNLALGTTANCYVTARSGYYAFPLVYGNAYDATKGVVPEAYRGPSGTLRDDGNVLSTFVDHLGNDIGSPFIAAQSVGHFAISHAAVLWSDTPNLVTNVAYNAAMFDYPSDHTKKVGGITFDIPNGTARQGNVVIALYDTAGRIVWSWHIWVSPIGAQPQYAVPYISGTGFEYKIAAVNLGWISFEKIKDYRSRKCKVKFKSVTGNSEVEILVAQMPHAVLAPGDALYYQWGRKDPFRGIDRNGSLVPLDVQRYPSTTKPNPKRALLSWRIKSPTVFHRMGLQDLTEAERSDFDQLAGKTDDLFENLWDSKNVGQTSFVENNNIKTVYDPCPPGFKVAPPDAFTGFLRSGGSDKNPNDWNGIWDEVYKDWAAYSNKNHMAITLFPTLGYRDYDNLAAMYFRDADCYLWTSGAWNHSGGIYFLLRFKPAPYICFYNRFIMGNGYNIRAVMDEDPVSNRVSPRRR